MGEFDDLLEDAAPSEGEGFPTELASPSEGEESGGAGVGAPSAVTPGAAVVPRVSPPEIIRTKEEAKALLEKRVGVVGEPAVTGTAARSDREPVRSPSRFSRGRKKESKKKERVAVPARSKTDCRRWMHHRPGVYCKECGRTP